MVQGKIVPPFGEIEAVLDFGRELQDCEPLVLDFSKIGFARPTGMLLLAAIIEDARMHGRVVTEVGAAPNSYEANMGFYEACGIDVPKGNAPGGATYYPVTVHNVRQIQDAAASRCQPIGEYVNFMVGRLAYLVTQESRGNLFETVKYCLREIIRNAVEHSESDVFSVMGQYWPTLNEVELAVLDHGIGLRNSLSQSPRFSGINNDVDAIRLALFPSVSGKKRYSSDSEVDEADDEEGEWGNSGFGLFMTSQMARATGRFLVGSGDSALSLAGGGKTELNYGMPGTLISMTMNVGGLQRLETVLGEIATRGESVARRHLSSGTDVMASAASKLIMGSDD